MTGPPFFAPSGADALGIELTPAEKRINEEMARRRAAAALLPPVAAEATRVDAGDPTLRVGLPGIRAIGSVIRQGPEPREDERFLNALRFVVGQEAPAEMPPGRAVVSGAGLSDPALAEYERRNPDASLNDPNANMKVWYDIWRQSGAGRLPDPLALVHYDAAVQHGPGTAREMLVTSAGDPQRYVALREQHYRDIPNIGVTGDPSGRGEGGLEQNPGWLKKRMPALRRAAGLRAIGQIASASGQR